MTIRMTRREFAALAGAAALAHPAFAQNNEPLSRAIPSSGERLPAVGLGTASVFNSADGVGKATSVLEALIVNGGRLIDTASTYGSAESVLGEVIDAGKLREKVFIATKSESPDLAEFKRSLARLKTAKVDLMQLHNVSDPQQSLARFR
ncbi:MAG: aldo/keto reductase, partial [Bryobacteraceae bacterium]